SACAPRPSPTRRSSDLRVPAVALGVEAPDDLVDLAEHAGGGGLDALELLPAGSVRRHLAQPHPRQQQYVAHIGAQVVVHISRDRSEEHTSELQSREKLV